MHVCRYMQSGCHTVTSIFTVLYYMYVYTTMKHRCRYRFMHCSLLRTRAGIRKVGKMVKRILFYLSVTSFRISTEHFHLCFPSKVFLGQNLK